MNLTKIEVLWRLYHAPFIKKIINNISGGYEEISKNINRDKFLSESQLRRILVELSEEEILVLHHNEGCKLFFQVDREKILITLEQDDTYIKIYKLIEDNYYLIPK